MSHLTSEQRYAIQLMSNEYTQTKIAEIIGKSKSVVSREISRNADKRNGVYDADLAQRKYKLRLKEKPKCIKLTSDMKGTIDGYIKKRYSPEQLINTCKALGVAVVSAERIYQYIWEDKKKEGSLYKTLRTEGKRYRKRGNSKDSRGIIKNRTPIAQRPDIVDKKDRIGDLEIDTIIGKDHKGAIVTINDRATGKLFMKKLNGKDAAELAAATIELLQPYKHLLKTITSDNGKEFAYHELISKALDIDFYFAEPYKSWQRGANENLNGLIRQYIPKKTDFSTITDDYISWVQEELNERPRKRYNFTSPNKIFNQKVAFVS